MVYREKIAICSEIHTQNKTTVCGQNVGFASVKVVGYNVTTQLERVKVFFVSSREINL
jgi:hypothetical protein